MKEIKKKNISQFINESASSLNTFRTLILFGKNTATYKFAFCHALLKQKSKSFINYQDLTEDFLSALYQHHKVNPYQFQTGENTLTKAMDVYTASGESDEHWNKLRGVSEGIIYNHVFDAFQNVGGGTIDKSFLLFEHIKKDKQLVLTDNMLRVLDSEELINTILQENEARWAIVESAWQNGISTNLLGYSSDTNELYVGKKEGRVNLRSAVSTLSPYQKGKCFYCRRTVDATLHKDDDAFADVDHFFSLKSLKESKQLAILSDNNINLNGVWNLVIACKACNRGKGGKFEQRADDMFYEKLLKRNLYFLEEHKHTLKTGICSSLNVNNSNQLQIKMKEIFEFLAIREGWKPELVF